MNISQSESSAISLVRILAMLSIVSCHFLQAYDNDWAWVMNIGVQIFLVLSGYLYGHKQIDKWGHWYLMRIVKLYVPLFIYTTVAMTVIKYCSDTPVSVLNYVKMGGVDGLNHLWFMKAIAVCYIITPLLQLFRKYALYALVGVSLLGIAEYAYLHINLFTFAWFWLYAVGYYYGALADRGKIQKAYLATVVVIAIVMTCFCTWQRILSYDGFFNRSWHNILGVALCLGGIYAFTKLKIQQMPHALKVFDKNSFYIYICHHIYLIGPLALPLFIQNDYLSASLALVLIIITTIVYAYISNFVIDKIKVHL